MCNKYFIQKLNKKKNRIIYNKIQNTSHEDGCTNSELRDIMELTRIYFKKLLSF